MGALARLAVARARRRPAGWLLSAVGIALTIAYAGGVVAESTITADRSARAVLLALPDADKAVRVTSQNVITPRIRADAAALISQLGLPAPTEVVLMNPVRLGGIVVRPAGITPLPPWVFRRSAARAAAAPCTPVACPVLIASGAHLARSDGLTAPGVHLQPAAIARLRSALPLGFVPRVGSAPSPPLLISGDANGLERLSGLDGIARTHSWIAPLPVGSLHAWQIGPLAQRLHAAQQRLLASSNSISVTAPFTALEAARQDGAAAPERLWLAGGGAAAALAMFVVLAGGALRRDQRQELDRLRNSGARRGQLIAFATIEAGLLCGVATIIGAALGLMVAVVLAGRAGAPAGAILAHSLLTPAWIAVLFVTWLLGTALLAGAAAVRGGRLADTAALAAAAALALALSVTHAAGGSDPTVVLLAPLCALAGGVLVFRLTSVALRSVERVSRRGPVMMRLALVGLARAPAAPALAAAFLAVSVGLAGFALCYRATLLRGAADEAADRVPLDGIIAPGPDFTRPLQLASLTRWHALVGGTVWPIRRTDASYIDGGASVTVPALGVPAAAIVHIHGWRASDGSAPLRTLARRLVPAGPLHTPGPRLDPRTRRIRLGIDSPGVALDVTADLRGPGEMLRRLELGRSGAQRTTLWAAIPRGRWELAGLEFHVGAGLEATNGHQNAENPAAATQFTATIRLGPLDVGGARIATWRGTGAVGSVRANGPAHAVLRFDTSAVSGLLRPTQPSDARPVPVLSSQLAPPGRLLSLTVDGQPLRARVVGVARRFPTLPESGFIVADEATLAAALDAQSPGEVRSNELWQLGGRRSAPFPALRYAWRAEVERTLRDAPVARALLGTMLVAAALAGGLALAGLLVALLGTVRDRRIEQDLIAQGLAMRELRSELRTRVAVASAFGIATGLGIAVLLTVLALAAVRAGLGTVAPQPPLVTAVPWPELAALALGTFAACGLAALVGAASSRGVR